MGIGQYFFAVGIELGFIHKQGGFFAANQQIRQENRVVWHVAAAQVGNPGDIVQAGYQVMVGTGCLHGLADAFDFLGSAFGHKLGFLGEYGFIGCAGAVGPDVVQQINVVA